MNITNVQHPLVQQLGGNNWRFTIRYTATFTPQETNQPLNYTFRDSIQIREDDPFDDDLVTGWVTASNFNPGATSVQRTLVTVVNGDDLDTELGGEEIYARIRLRNFTTGGVAIERNTPNINLAP